jgi:hypothetical protein
MIIVNYTPDDIEYVHGGLTGTLKSGEMDDVDSGKGNFLLNKYDQKGMLKLVFGDDPALKKAEAMELWKEFWTKQIVIHNQANEARQARNLEYSRAPKEVEEHAKVLGLKLLGPWAAQVSDNEEMQALKNENADLRVQMNSMSSRLDKLLSALEKTDTPEALKIPEQKFSLDELESVKDEKREEEAEVVTEALTEAEQQIQRGPDEEVVDEISGLPKAEFIEWVMGNTAPIMNEYDPPTQTYVRERWSKLCTEDWPLPI